MTRKVHIRLTANYKHGFILTLSLFLSLSIGMREAYSQRESEIPERVFASAYEAYTGRVYEQAIASFAHFRERYPDHPNVAEALYYEAESSLALGHEDRAVVLFELFQQQFPTHPLAFQARVALGKHFFENQSYERAIETLSQVVEDGPPPELGAKALYWMGESALQLDREEEAIQHFQRVSSQYPTSTTAPVALYAVAYVRVKQERLQDAARAFELLSVRHPDSPYAQDVGLALAEVYFELGDYRRAVEEIERRINTLSEESRERALFLLAESYNQLKDTENAIVYYRRVLEGSEDSPYYRPALYGLAWSFFQQTNYQWASENFEKVRQNANDYLAAKATYYEAVNRELADEPENAINLFEEFLNEWPDHDLAEPALYELGVTYYGERNWEEAERAFATLVDRYPDSEFSGETLHLLGNAYIALNDYDRAFESFDRAIELDAAPAELKEDITFQRAWLLYRNQDYNAAAPAFLQIYEAKSQGDRAGDALFWAAESNYQLGNQNEATRLFRTYLRDFRNGKHIDAAHYALGWVYFKNGQYGEAAGVFERFLDGYKVTNESVPYRTDALLRLADSYYALKRYSQSVRAYAQAAEEGGDYALYQIGQAYANASNSDEAIKSFRRLLSEYPDSEWSQEAVYKIGYLYFLGQEYDQAISEYREIIETWPRDPLAAKAQYAIGDALFNAGRMAEAVDAYRLVLERYPDSPFTSDAASSIQYALIALGDDARASEIIDSFAEENPDSPLVDELKFRQAEVKYQSGKVSEASVDFQRFIDTSSNDVLRGDALYYLGVIAFDRKEFDRAEIYLTELLNTYPRSTKRAEALRRLGEIYLEEERFSEALNQFELLERENPDDKRLEAEARYGQSTALIALGRTEEAERILSEITSNAPDAPESLPALLGLARLYESQDRTVDAIRAYRQVVQRSRDETGAEALYHLGSLMLERGDARTALEEYSRIPILYSGFAEWIAQSYLGQARALHQLGRDGDAVRMYDRVINEYADSQYARIASEEKAVL